MKGKDRAHVKFGVMRKRTVRLWASGVVFFLIGLLISVRTTLFSGLSWVQGDMGDVRTTHYILEHSYVWLLSLFGLSPDNTIHTHLWNLPIFYPAQDFSHTFNSLATAPIYWIFQLLGFAKLHCYQLWMLTNLSLNYLAAWLFFRRCLKYHWIACGMGAFLFAFGAPRISQLGHPEVIAHYFYIAAAYGIFRILKGGSRYSSRIWMGIILISLMGQIGVGIFPSAVAPFGEINRFGMGIATTVLALLGLRTLQSKRYFKPIFPIAVVALLLAMLVNPFKIALLFVGAWSLALFVHSRKKVPLMILFCLVPVFEQVVKTKSFDGVQEQAWVQDLKTQVGAECKYFYYSPIIPHGKKTYPEYRFQLDAMWAEIETGTPTLNGHAHQVPEGWDPLYETIIYSNKDEQRLRPMLEAWINEHHLDPQGFCWIRSVPIDLR